MVYQTKEELEKKLARLRNEKEVREDMNISNNERKKIKSQIRKMEYSQAIEVGKTIGRGAKVVGRVSLKAGKKIAPVILKYGRRIADNQVTPKNSSKVIKKIRKARFIQVGKGKKKRYKKVYSIVKSKPEVQKPISNNPFGELKFGGF